jgi:hypothetical protein
MITSYSELLNHFGIDESNYQKKQVHIFTDTFKDGLILKNIDDKTVVIKTKENPTVNDIKILFYPIKQKFLEKVFDSLSNLKEEKHGNAMV